MAIRKGLEFGLRISIHKFSTTTLTGCHSLSESIHRVKSEPESCPSPSQVESQVSSIPFFSQTTRSSSIRMASSGKCEFFFKSYVHIQ